jgi:hypothetical protein
MGLAQAATCEIVQLEVARSKLRAPRFDDTKSALFDWMYANAPKNMVMLAFPGRSWRGLEKRGLLNGLQRPGHRRAIDWNVEAVADLRRRWPGESRDEIQQAFPARTWTSICRKAEKLGLRRAAPALDALPLTHIPGERWRPIAGLEHYAVSDRGRVTSGARLMRQLLNRGGRPTVWLTTNGAKTSRAVATLVIEAFGQTRPKSSYIVGYQDGNALNVIIENLLWVARSGRPGPCRSRSPKPRARYLPLGERLKASLALDPIWAAADAALSRNLRPDIREDVIANMILAHLEGGLPLQAFPTRASDYVRGHNRFYSTAGRVSLDQSVPGTDGLRIGDLVSEDDYRDRWDLLSAGR